MNDHTDEKDPMLPSSLDLVTSWLNRPVPQGDGYVGPSFHVNARLQAPQYMYLEALTKQSHVSRNKMFNHLIQVGIDTVLEQLPKDVVEQVDARAVEILDIKKEELK